MTARGASALLLEYQLENVSSVARSGPADCGLFRLFDVLTE